MVKRPNTNQTPSTRSRSSKTAYAHAYRDVDFRQHPELYIVGRGEQGVLIAQPYKDEILPYWKFATPDKARQSAEKIYVLFERYKAAGDFVGMDMSRKFLQMGFTRSRRYANHADGNKYAVGAKVIPPDLGSETSDKAKSATIFYAFYIKAKDDPEYRRRLEERKRTD